MPMSDAELIRVPFQAELARRRHVAYQRRGGDDGGAREISLAAEAHPILPVAVERRDRALPFLERVRALTETRSAPRLTNLAADRAEHVRDRLAVEPLIGPLDLLRDAARSREDDERLRRLLRAALARRADDERRGEQIVVAAVGARADHRLVERDVLARHVLRRKRVAGTERLRDHRRDAGQIERF